MTAYEKLCRLIDALEEVPGHPNMRRESGLRVFLEFVQEMYVPKDELMSEIRAQLRNDPTILRDALGDTRVIVEGKVAPIVVGEPTEIAASVIDGRTWAEGVRPDGCYTTVSVAGKFEWIGIPSFDKSDFLRAIFLPDNGIRFAPTVFEVPYIIEDPENVNPDRFERVRTNVKGPIKTNQFPVDIGLLDATASIEEKESLGSGYQIRGRYLMEDEGHWEWAPETDVSTPGVKRIIYRPNDPKLKAASTLVRVIKEEVE